MSRRRCLQQISSGRWADFTVWTEADEIPTPAESHISDVAAALGLPPEDLRAVDTAGDEDPRTGALLTPPRVAPPADPDWDALEGLLAKSDAELTGAQKLEAVLRAVRRLRRAGVLRRGQ